MMSNKKNIGYILGMDVGIHRFIYRELKALDAEGYNINIYPTKINEGVYNPKSNWQVHKFNPLMTIIKQPLYWFTHKNYFKELKRAIVSKSLVEFLIATEHAKHMKDLNRIHAHFGDVKLFIGAYCKAFTGLPLTVTIHAHELWRNASHSLGRKSNEKLFVESLLRTDKIITISNYNKEVLVNKFKIPEEKIEVIRLFVDPKEDIITRKKILAIGSFEERKGYDVLIKALSSLKRRDFELWICGEGYLPVKQWVDEAGLTDNVKFFGKLHSDILTILIDDCDFFVMPSKTVKVKEGYDKEGIPVVLMEAMLAAKPVISTKHAGIPELVTNHIVKQNNSKELAKAINYLLNNPNKYSVEGKANQKIVLKDYHPRNIKKLINLFEEKTK